MASDDRPHIGGRDGAATHTGGNLTMKKYEEPTDPEAEPEVDGDESQDAGDSESGQAAEDSNELQTAIAQRDQFQDQWLRAQAELDNFRKRTQREAQQNRLYQSLPLIRDLLPGIDNLERAIVAAESSTSLEELLQGVRMVSQHFQDVLGRHAVESIPAVGEPFDPNKHEAVQQMPSADHPAMTVLNEVERGYQLHDRVIRPSKVIVSTVPPDATGS